MVSLKRPNKLLNLRSGDRFCVVPLFGLDITIVEPQMIFFDDALAALIPAFANNLSGVLSAASIAHGNEHIDYQGLKETGGTGRNLLQQLLP